MKIVKLTSKEFENFAKKNKYVTFHQKESWGKLKEKNGWDYELVGFKDDKKVIAATLLLSKKMPFGLKMYYAPRGFLIDFFNKKLLDNFVKEIKIYIKEQGGTFLKIDPYVPHLERDVNGDVVEGGSDNSELVDHLKELGFIHHGYNIDTDKELQPRWMFTLDLKDRTEDELFNNIIKPTRKNIKKTMKIGLEMEEIGIEGLEEYKRITEHTGNRRGFIDRPLSYYQEMFNALGDKISIILCYLNIEKSINLLQTEIDTINGYSDITEKRKEEIKSLEKKIDELKELEEKHGKRIALAGSMFIACEKELLNLYGGGYDEFMRYDAMYAIQWHAIKTAKEKGFELYNFYGIEGNFKKENNPMYGVYEFKKGFGGKVVELIGEFDLPVNKAKYKFYTLAFSSYKKLKNTINRIKNK